MYLYDQKKWNEIKQGLLKVKEEVQDMDKCLNDYNDEIGKLNEEIPELEKELKFWKRDKKKIETKGFNEDLKVWEDEIESINNSLMIKQRKKEKIQIEIRTLKEKLKESNKYLKNQEKSVQKDLISKLNQISETKDNDNSIIEYSDIFNSNIEILKSLIDLNSIYKDSKLNMSSFLTLINNKVAVDNYFLISCVDAFDEDKISIVPQFISKFILEYIKDIKPRNILDLGFNVGSSIIPISKNLKDSENVGIIRNEHEKEIISILYQDMDIKWCSNAYLDESNNIFDIILGHTIFESNLESLKLDLDGNLIELKDNLNVLEMLNASLKLDSNGTGFFLMRSDLMLFKDNYRVISNLEKFGLFIDTILNIPKQFLPKRESEKILLIIKREKPENIFIGQLEPKNMDILLENLKDRKEGKIPEHGALTDLDFFYTFKTFVAGYESKEMAKKTELEPITLNEISEKIMLLKKKEDATVNVNSVFLPLSEFSKVLTSLDDLELESNDYFQIILKENIAFPEYLGHFLDTQLGQKIRETLNIGEYQDIQNEILSKTEVYLPDWNDQIEIVRINSLIDDIITRAENNKIELWNLPKSASKIRKEIESFEGGASEEKFEGWIESLPFPLASILWESITNPNYERKVKYLLQFFEAFSEFNVTIMLSGLASDKKLFREEFSHCISSDLKYRGWIFRPTFGNWNNLGVCLAKKIRLLLRDKSTRSKCLELFGNPNIEFLQRITNTKLYDIFFEVINYRNQWEGHGPMVSDNEYRNRHKILESVLSRVHQIISTIYADTRIVLPERSIFKDGIHNYTVRELMTTRPPFKTRQVETTSLMDSSNLYLLNENQKKPLEILPFFLIMNEVCYYYNGYIREEDAARYVSYHNNEVPEIYIPMDKFNNVISLLVPKNDYF